MNMETLLNTIINNMNFGIKTDTSVLGSLNIGDFMSQGLELQVGQKITLIVNENMEVQITPDDGEQILLPQAEITIDKAGILKSPVTIEAKVSQTQNQSGQIQLQIQNIDNQSPQQYIRQIQNTNTVFETPQVAIIKDISGLSNIQLPNVSLVETAAPYIAELPITQEQKSALQTAMRQIEIKVTVPNQNQSEISAGYQFQQNSQPVLTQIEHQLAKTMAKLPEVLSNNPSPDFQKIAIQSSVKQLSEQLQEIVGQQLPAQTLQTEQNVVLNTPLGEVRPELPIQLPENVVIDLQIAEIIFSEVPEEVHLPSFTENIEQTLTNIKTTEPQLFAKILKHLPSDNEHLLQQITAFVKAAGKGDIRQWLGNEIVEHLAIQGDRGQEILSDLQTVLQQSNKQTSMWRIIEIPYYAENHIDKIRLAIKQYPDEKETQEEQRQKFGTRFVVDTNFSQLGAFQFDGFSLVKDRRFDLVIRTERSVDNDLCANIMQLFKTTLNEVGYVGNIKINLKENFIKISENNDDDKFLPRDLFI